MTNKKMTNELKHQNLETTDITLNTQKRQKIRNVTDGRTDQRTGGPTEQRLESYTRD